VWCYIELLTNPQLSGASGEAIETPYLAWVPNDFHPEFIRGLEVNNRLATDLAERINTKESTDKKSGMETHPPNKLHPFTSTNVTTVPPTSLAILSASFFDVNTAIMAIPFI
jgi:hypothetical protein